MALKELNSYRINGEKTASKPDSGGTIDALKRINIG
jgi:hypothetical protein